jgi:PncC family amidohydrolase
MTEHLISLLKEHGLKISTAESCTGGLVASKITSISGSSEIFQMGFVTYAEESKMKYVGVKPQTLKDHSVYSREVAVEMALGCIEETGADIGIGITGVAGVDPVVVMIDGNPVEIEPGTVYISCAMKKRNIITVISQKYARNPKKSVLGEFGDFRNEVREAAADCAIDMAIDLIEEEFDNVIKSR